MALHPSARIALNNRPYRYCQECALPHENCRARPSLRGGHCEGARSGPAARGAASWLADRYHPVRQKTPCRRCRHSQTGQPRPSQRGNRLRCQMHASGMACLVVRFGHSWVMVRKLWQQAHKAPWKHTAQQGTKPCRSGRYARRRRFWHMLSPLVSRNCKRSPRAVCSGPSKAC